MKLWGAAAQVGQLVTLSALCASALADSNPVIKHTKFAHLPVNLNYFEDSDSIVFQDIRGKNVHFSKDAGVTWDRVDKVPDGKAVALQMHPFDSKAAYIFTNSKKHYKTTDGGKSWESFTTSARPSDERPGEILSFNAEDPKRIIYNAMDCGTFFCSELAEYTTDNFGSSKVLRDQTSGCWWAKSTREFTTGDKELDKKRIMCIAREKRVSDRGGHRLVMSDDFFAVQGNEYKETEPELDTNKVVKGIASVAPVKKYILVATASSRSDEMALFVTDDTKKWHRAMFPRADTHDHSHIISQDGYTVLESTNYSIQLDVMSSRPSKPMGVLFTSNSNGTYFTENAPYTNRNADGNVDFEKISGIQGVFMINTVENGAEVEKDGKEKNIITQISFDDGRTMEHIKAGDDNLHLHSVSNLRSLHGIDGIDNIGRVFSSPAPGLVMGVGNTGKSLKATSDADLYVSDNAGITWKKALSGHHIYEFGDSGSILVAVKHSKEADVKKISYSLDHGENWKETELPDGQEIRPLFLTTVQDSTSLKFVLVGEKKKSYFLFAIDFDGLHERKCGDGDMEDWHARADDSGKATCIMGQKQTFRRRKKTADCFIKSDFKEPLPQTETCECTDVDFECDYNFERDPEDAKKCKASGPAVIPDGACKDKNGKFKGSSGWRLIPGNLCKRKDGKQLDDPVEQDCSGKEPPSDPSKPSEPSKPADGKVSHTQKEFDSDLKDFQKVYLSKDGGSSDTEVIIARPAEFQGGQVKPDDKIYRSTNHGKDWEQILKGEKVNGIYPHEALSNVVFFTTADEKKVIYTVDSGKSYHTFEPKTPAGDSPPLAFHPNRKDWLLWVGKRCDKVGGKEDCYHEASVSFDRGDNWDTIRRHVDHCEFTGNTEYKFRPEKQIVCLARMEENNDAKFTLVTKNDVRDTDEKWSSFDGEVTNFATMSEFIVVAQVNSTGALHAFSSLDGKKFEQALFPHSFHETHTAKFTVLDSSNHAVNLFVLTSDKAGRSAGSIMKSNSNGTSYVLSAANVNADSQPLVDFEKVTGLEGVTIINTVSNAGEDKEKHIQTKISHNDGANWLYLAPPSKDADGKSYKCSSSKGDDQCALHFHHYTEREDKDKSFSAESAVGFIAAHGNVGPALAGKDEADTFLSTDGGISWKSVKKGRWMWQFADQGAIIVLVQSTKDDKNAKTNMLSYSIDNGNTWKDYEFSKDKVSVLDMTSAEAGTSRNIVLWTRSEGGKLATISVDFTGLSDKPCKFDENESKSDYELWTPKHPSQNDNCLFGHVSQYLRKKVDKTCFNEQDNSRLHKIEDCKCTRADFECAYNYELHDDGQCKLVPGLQPLSGEEWCKLNPNETVWYAPTGFRRAPSTTCKNGKELDKNLDDHPCAGYEEEYERTHRTSGVAIFFAVVIPFALAGAIGSYVYRNWNGKFGQIRLGEASSATFDSDQPWIKYPVIAISAAAAILASLPLLVGSLVRSASSSFGNRGHGRSWFSSTARFTTRDSFARSRGAYTVVEDVEGELLGEDSDEEF